MAQQNNPATENLNIITININGGLSTKLRDKKFRTIIKNNDVIMLQEAHVGRNPSSHSKVKIMDSEDFKLFGLKLKAPAKGYFTFFSSQSRGVGIIITVKHKVTQIFHDEGNYIGLCTEINKRTYIFLSFYFHKDEGEGLLGKLLLDIEHEKGIHIIGGDFNVTCEPRDIQEDTKYHCKRRTMFKSAWPNTYIDVWRSKHGGKADNVYTRKCDKQGSRLDYFFMKQEDFEHIAQFTNCEILPDELRTDHKAVKLSFQFPQAPNRIKKWKTLKYFFQN